METFNLLKKKGIRDVYQVLTKFKNYEADLHAFYKEFNKFSYYNAFIRIRNDLVARGLISIEDRNGKKIIILTRKGKTFYNKLLEIDEIIK